MFNVRTIIKLFTLFLFFQILINGLIEFTPQVRPDVMEKEADYLTFLKSETNLFDGKEKGQSLLQDFKSGLEMENLFNDGIINSFLGVLKIAGQVLLFIFEVAILILITPSILMNILLFAFVGMSSILTYSTILVNLGFYSLMFWIVFRGRTK